MNCIDLGMGYGVRPTKSHRVKEIDLECHYLTYLATQLNSQVLLFYTFEFFCKERANEEVH